MIPTILKDTLSKSYGSDFINLIEDWGRWSRYFGCIGYHSGHDSATPKNLTDETALILNTEFAWLKNNHKELWFLIELRYIKGLTVESISNYYFKQKKYNKVKGIERNRNSVAVDPVLMGAYKLSNSKGIELVLNDTLRLIYVRLKRKYLNESF